MNQRQKKCVVVSVGLHLLLLLVLALGSAWKSSRPEPLELPPIDFTPLITTDDLVSGGGNPDAKPQPMAPAPTPARPAPRPAPPPELRPQPERTRDIEPQPDTASNPEPDSLEPTREHRKKPQIDLSAITVRKRNRKEAIDRRAEEEQQQELEQSRAEARERRRAAELLSQAAGSLGEGLSSTTRVELKGPGGGGLPYANFYQAVRHIYEIEWRPLVPRGIKDNSAVPVASVTIGRDGTVLSAELTEPSGNRELDDSVRACLNLVRHVTPLPAGAQEDKRTVSIRFQPEPQY